MQTQKNIKYLVRVEACVGERLTPRTLDLEVWGSSLARRVVSLDKELYYTLSLLTRVYKWVLVTYCWGITLRWTSIPSRGGEGSSNTPRHASCHGNRYKLRPSLRGRRLKGKGKGVLGARETRGAGEEGGRETPARGRLFFSFLTSTR